MTTPKRTPQASPTRRRRPDPARVRAAFRALLSALGTEPAGELAETPERAARLWLEHLMAGEGVDLGRALGRATPSASTAPVSLFGIGVHLVCPHHLTIAFGQAHVAYVPNGRIVGFGALARLVEAATARLSLQEDVTNTIANALVDELGASAAVAVIDATHPCHNVLHARSHGARAVTWAVRGRRGTALERELRRALASAALSAARPPASETPLPAPRSARRSPAPKTRDPRATRGPRRPR